MAKVKVILDKDEDQLDADNALYKALSSHVNGDVHVKESFDDPAMVDASERLVKLHEDLYKEMLEEISLELDKEYLE